MFDASFSIMICFVFVRVCQTILWEHDKASEHSIRSCESFESMNQFKQGNMRKKETDSILSSIVVM